MDAKPKEAMLVPFIADAPTTTMQRLKGLTTGSLPTFIDASQNFASEEISEDNIIDQLVKHQKQVIVLGDDTWNGLFPRRFKRSFLFPSFNVMDLHTVDNGILQHLEEELQKNDWNVMISHFLGVDHCGHRYGPDHPEMTAKLSQMNDIIKNVADRIGTDTLLLVFGDHGMTKTGDHGGDSQGEITAALFAYSPGLNMMPANPNSIHPVQVSQVDIVPTLALALGVPIPYSNLVYGLATAVSAPVVSIVTALLVVLTMLAGDGLAPAVLVLVVTATSCFMVQAVCSWMTANDIETLLKPSWTALSVWFILSVHGFYVTGHQPTFSSLHWSAAFVGFTGDWGGSNFFPALLVGFNTFMAQILFGLSLPLIVLAPLAIGVAFPRLRGNRLESEETSRGEFLLVDRPEKAKEAVLFTAGSYILLHAAKCYKNNLSS
ncbi:hypothetical protein C7M84_008726 [Penaeus vannamei]|uniref:Uncharacterized protein n=1 Tax=Penaeus vannamei TaxID=6689 RepID=A0A423T8T2_PENVA|nr:hypothetical protein C7M84_008726 [Penaeus vannamei]